ncbi:hypothetical protein NE865_07797 [Phthorimaea operculella]|nr:hypothetical protein NE865_07797 [Phthorimaea operculella]
MFKHLVLLCVVICVIEAMPKWQFLPPRDGYVPVYIQSGDTPLEEINPDLAEAFHALPAGRSAGKHLDAAPDTPEQAEQPQGDQPRPDAPEPIDHRPYEKKVVENKAKKASEITKPEERR